MLDDGDPAQTKDVNPTLRLGAEIKAPSAEEKYPAWHMEHAVSLEAPGMKGWKSICWVMPSFSSSQITNNMFLLFYRSVSDL